MKGNLIITIALFFASQSFGQNYERSRKCGSDTINVAFRTISRSIVHFKAFECTKVSKLGIRIDLGTNHYIYNSKTRNWLGNHFGPLFGLAIAYGDLNFGARFKPATVHPNENLDFNGVLLTSEAKLNPIKLDYDLSYSINFKSNISLEPFVGLTVNNFIVINEADLRKTYKIKKTNGLTIGIAVNKYFHIKGYQFFSIFVKYGYGFTNYKKVNANLGVGYSDLAIGIAYKAFFERHFLKKIKPQAN